MSMLQEFRYMVNCYEALLWHKTEIALACSWRLLRNSNLAILQLL